MHHLIQGGKVRSQVINVPEGLPELLSDITREVLRCQPTTECLCQFIIDYLHSVIIARDKARIAQSIIDRSLRLVDDVIADLCICDISKEKSDHMCEAMEHCFRRFLEQRRCEKAKTKEIIKFNDFDMLNELMQRCKFTEEELKISKPLVEEAYQKFVNAYMTSKDSTGGTDCLYEYFRKRETIRMEQRLKEESAIKIQSNFRGYLARKLLFLNEPIQQSISLVSQTPFDQNQLELAALKIQQFFRRHRSTAKSSDVETERKQCSEDSCSPTSNISLTAGPTDHHDTNEKDNDTNENQNQNQYEQTPNDVIPQNLTANENIQDNIDEVEEIVEEEDFNIEGIEENVQNE